MINGVVESSHRSFANAIKWAYAANLGEKLLGALFTFILAAMLGPRDFGVIAIAMSYILFLQMLLDQGFMAALIQRKVLEPEHLDSVFWVTLTLSLALIPISVVFGGWWAAQNHSLDVGSVIAILSLCIPIEGLASVQSAILRRHLDFRALAIRTNIASLAGGSIGTALAIAGYGVWALVGQQITKDLVALVLLWSLSDWRPRIAFSWKHLKELASFSISNFIAQLGVFAEGQASLVMLGVFFGPVAVGLYRIADRLTSGVVSMATSSIQSVSLPEFSRLQGRPEELKKSVLKCLHLSSTMTTPILSIMAASSYSIVAILGSKWTMVANALTIFCLIGICSVFAYFTGPLLQAASKTRQLAALEWTRVVLGVLLILGASISVRNVAVEHQVTVIAIARLFLVAGLVAPIYLWLLLRLSGLTVREVTSAVRPSIVGSVSAAGAIEILRFSGLLSGQSASSIVGVQVVIGGAVGLAVLLTLDTTLRGMIYSLLRMRFGQAQSQSLASDRDVYLTLGSPVVEMDSDLAQMRTDVPPALVSIVVPTYNRAYALPDAIVSVLRQTYVDFEVIVVDDGSTDETLQVLEQFKDSRIQLIRHERNRGCSAAYNTGIAAARGQYLAFLDSDDLWKPNYLENQVRVLNDHTEVGVSFCDTEIFINGENTGTLMSLLWVFPRLLRAHPGQTEYILSRREMHLCLLDEVPVKPSAAVARLEVLKQLGECFVESWPSGTDWDLFLRLSWITNFGFIDRALAIQQRTVDSTHQRFLEKDKQFLLTFLRAEKSLLKSDREATSAVNRGIARAYNSLGWYYLRAGRWWALLFYARGFIETRQLFLIRKMVVAVVRLVLLDREELAKTTVTNPHNGSNGDVRGVKQMNLSGGGQLTPIIVDGTAESAGVQDQVRLPTDVS